MSTPYYIEPGFWDPETGRKVAILINDAQGMNDNPTISYPSASGTVALTTDLPNTLTLVASGNASFPEPVDRLQPGPGPCPSGQHRRPADVACTYRHAAGQKPAGLHLPYL